MPDLRCVPPWLRGAAAIALAALTCLLLRPPPPSPHPVTWSDLLFPLAPGMPVGLDYRLSPPRRGEEHDLVLTLRRTEPPARVEIHVLDRGRWKDVLESRSYGIAYELPRSSAPESDSVELTRIIADTLRKNDHGAPPVDAVPLAREPDPPLLARALAELHGFRGLLALLASSASLLLLSSLPHGLFLSTAVLTFVGLLLRLSHLHLPFVHDQDVQRVFTGHASISEILTGIGLEDRHPPLYFLVLHAIEAFGQSEATVRAPAAIAGALIGPSIVLSSAWVQKRKSPLPLLTLLAALAITLSPELIARSREVSEIPLFSLFAIALTASIARAQTCPERAPRALPLVTASIALALYTYYLAPFLIAGAFVGAFAARPRAPRLFLRPALFGFVLGLPALALAARIFFKDRSAREVAASFPTLAWGDRTPGEMLSQMQRLLVETFGIPLLIVFAVLCTLTLVARRDRSLLIPLMGFAFTFVGTALLAPVARMQPYYISSLSPLLALAAAWADLPEGRLAHITAPALAALGTASLVTEHAAAYRPLYMRDPAAFMDEFAHVIQDRPEKNIAVVASYDATLLSYSLGRVSNKDLDWPRQTEHEAVFDPGTGERIWILARAHGLDASSEARAIALLDEARKEGPVLVIERDELHFARLSDALSRCERLLEAPSARLVACAAR